MRLGDAPKKTAHRFSCGPVSLVQTFLAVALICNDLQSVTPFSRESRVSGRLAVWEIRGKILTKMSGSGV